jgi:hypothetical protein
VTCSATVRGAVTAAALDTTSTPTTPGVTNNPTSLERRIVR